MIRIENLTKSFSQGFIPHKVRALDHLNLTVNRGEVFGYLGPNGAGKTTTIKLLMNLIFPDQGQAWIMGENVVERTRARQRVGFLPDQPYFYEYLTGREFLDFCGQLCGVPKSLREKRGAELLELLGMTEASKMQLRKYSRGMLQRIGLAQALINDSDLLILDEPMTGLDPVGRKEVRDIILDLKARGKTIFFSSHILSDAELICDRVGILLKGKLIAVGRLDELVRKQVKSVEITASNLDPTTLERLRPLAQRLMVQDEKVLLQVGSEEKSFQVTKMITEGGGRVHAIVPQRETLEDIFMREMRGN